MANLDTEKLINLIHVRPAIWDMRSEEYSNKLIKKRSWEEITAAFINEDATLEEKREMGNYTLKIYLLIKYYNIIILCNLINVIFVRFAILAD